MNTKSHHLEFLICISLVVSILLVFWDVTHHDFIIFDDDEYIYENQHVQDGLTKKGITWAFTSFHSNNWHPLTWIVHMLDCQFFGLRAGMHHLTSLFFHMANTLLLFLLFRKMTGNLWSSAFMSALFAFHPAHVESIAWASEKKDMVSTLFWVLTMWAYMGYTKSPGILRYVLVSALFAAGLLAKPMLVTLPFVLLLLDYWPLNRFNPVVQPNGGKMPFAASRAFQLILEKVPLFFIAAASSLITYLAQKEGGVVKTFEAVSLQTRISNGVVSYIRYVWKMIWPDNLAVLYPYPENTPLWQVLTAALLLVAVSCFFIRLARRYDYLAVGWLWFLGTLFPVIGLVQVGAQAMADRYTYIPFIGLFIIIAWGIPGLLGEWKYRRKVLGSVAGILILACMIGSWIQMGHWKDSYTLYSHTARVTSKNYAILNNLGNILVRQRNYKEAADWYREALQARPKSEKAHLNLGIALDKQGKFDQSIYYFSKALQLKPDDAKAHFHLGLTLFRIGKVEGAVEHLNEAIRLSPDDSKVYFHLGHLYLEQGNDDKAGTYFREALQRDPENDRAHCGMGIVSMNRGDFHKAVSSFSEAIRINPAFQEAKAYRQSALNQIKRENRKRGGPQ